MLTQQDKDKIKNAPPEERKMLVKRFLINDKKSDAWDYLRTLERSSYKNEIVDWLLEHGAEIVS